MQFQMFDDKRMEEEEENEFSTNSVMDRFLKMKVNTGGRDNHNYI